MNRKMVMIVAMRTSIFIRMGMRIGMGDGIGIGIG